MLGILGGDPRCPVARALDVLGEKWTLLLVRDALLGATRFSQFQRSLGIPREVLAARLTSLTEAGVFDRQEYREPGARPRDEYVLTPAGEELKVVLLALAGWADEHRPSPLGSDLQFLDTMDGSPVDIRVVASATGASRSVADIGVESPTITANFSR